MCYKHPRCAKFYASTILFLPAFERGFFNLDGLAHLHDVMGQLAVQTLAVGGQSSFGIGMLSPGRFVPLALFPVQADRAVFLDASFLVVVLWIIGTSLSIHLALEASFFAGIRREFLAERDESRFTLLWHNSQRRWSDIQAYGVDTDGVLFLL